MEPVSVLVITDDEATVDGRRDRDYLFVAEADLEQATGWVLKPQGLCRGEACVPVRDRSALGPEGWLDLTAVARAVRHPVAVDAEHAMVAIGTPAADRAATMASLEAADVRLPTVDGGDASVRDLTGRKRLVVSFASWCGCRHDLPAWQALHEKWEGRGFSVVGVAVDQSSDDIAPFLAEAKATFPVMLDADHRFVDAYGISNVPTVVWVDENDRVVRPNTAAFGDDEFIDFTGIPSGPHLAALERWVEDGEEPFADEAELRSQQVLPSDDAQLARTEFRLGLALHRAGHDEAAGCHFDEAGRLAPHDFTIRRAAMPLRGQDPFGEPFFDLYEEWAAAGRPYYREPDQLPPAPPDPPPPPFWRGSVGSARTG